jgi:hypothetical protein
MKRNTSNQKDFTTKKVQIPFKSEIQRINQIKESLSGCDTAKRRQVLFDMLISQVFHDEKEYEKLKGQFRWHLGIGN